MIRLLSAILLLVVLFGSVHIYQTAFAVCKVPIMYSIGTFDEQFSINREEAVTILKQAEAVWETPLDRELFVYEEGSSFEVNFIFDERQERLEAEYGFRERLDVAESVNTGIQAQYQALVSEYETLKEQYESKVNSYEQRFQQYNRTVAGYNQSGGAPEEVYASLKREREALERDRRALETQSRALNKLVDEINRVGQEGNLLVEQYNRGVGEYNKTFGESRQFTQGDYRGNHINIYSFNDENELALVVAHEFGHALGIDHVEGRESIMHYLIGEQPEDLGLSRYDQESFLEVCTTKSKWDRIIGR